MSDIINLLPDNVANQIAAGEVVDRPASAVKELLENAVDSGATLIQLIVKDAGRTLIQCIDNGCGMSEGDALRCFERHATSKIHQADDLFAIHTMGFRGEALASIAAVSQVELRTRLTDADLGSVVTIEGGDFKNQEPCSCAAGTSISVKNLFYNIPARRNFLKNDKVELSHIDDIFRRVAIVNNHVAFTFYSNGRLLYELHKGNKAQRIAAIFGVGSSERFYPIGEQTDLVSVEGYVGKPEYARKTRGEQYIFVNDRYIRHLALSAAIEKAYAELIPERSVPSYFVFIRVDPSRIDVNIHPTKAEVRFVDEHVLFAILRAATKKALGQFGLATELEFNPSDEIDFTPAPKGYVPPQPKLTFNPNYNPFQSAGGASTDDTTKGVDGPWRHFFDTESQPSSQSPYKPNTGADEPPQLTGIFSAVQADNADPLPASTPGALVYNGRYLITSIKSGVVVVDQCRAHERVLYERLMARKTRSATQGVGAQQLLFPVNCIFCPSDAELLGEMLPDLRMLGFTLDPMGNTTFVVTATPPDVKESELQSIFEQLLADFKVGMMQKFSDRDCILCRSLSRQMAVKPGTILQPEEVQSLLADLFACQAPSVTPFGKKTMFIVGEQDIREKLGGC